MPSLWLHLMHLSLAIQPLIRASLKHHEDEDQNLPLLRGRRLVQAVVRSPIQEAISQTFQSTAHLAKLLPTGTVMAFQLLSPIFTHQGFCDPVSQAMTSVLVALCGLSAFLLSFTDSFKDMDGNVCHGFATANGLWVIDGSGLPPQLADQYRLRFIDFLHAFMSILVFAAVALFDPNIVQCFYPNPSMDTQEMLTLLPVGIGVICSMFFVAFPSLPDSVEYKLFSLPSFHSLLTLEVQYESCSL